MLVHHVLLIVLLLLVSVGEGQQWSRGQTWDNRDTDNWWSKGLDWGTANQRNKQGERQTSDYYPTHKKSKQNSEGIRSRYYSRDYYYDDDDYSDSYADDLPSFQQSRHEPEQRDYYSKDRTEFYYPAEHRQHGHGRTNIVAPLVFLAPLAGIAALYAMAYVNSNPALLSLVTISGRKKRSVSFNNLDLLGGDLDPDEEGAEYMKEVGILSRFLTNTPGLDFNDQRDFLMAGILKCSSIGSSQCLDSLVCEYSRDQSSYNDIEKDTISMVLYHLLVSSHIDEDVKSRLRIAAGLGKKDHCSIYTCELYLQ